ncbi:F-box/FBD/LRR-repeat protein [Trifolium pratense]|uniref:F-box/FBD/LRR-repeat protein n=1 Tax=Trifolium pratense TaxID=57577 RepID=A0A2K3NFB1_TRIPR|nr:F-box/FBD/LRR-repeat protein [Trifolium pratense]
MASSRSRPHCNSDRLSLLPSNIRLHILSFLSTKHAATTSVLSTSWKNLWKEVTSLDFDHTSFNGDYQLMYDVIQSVLKLEKPSIPIHSLRLKTCKGVDMKHVNLLLDRVMQTVQLVELNILEFNAKKIWSSWTSDLMNTPLNPKLFTSKNLISMKLKNLYISDFEGQISLPLLRRLCLDTIVFNNGENILKLLMCCPFLEDLHTLGPIRVITSGNFTTSGLLSAISTFPTEMPICHVGNNQVIPRLLGADLSEPLYFPLSLFFHVQALTIEMSGPFYLPIPIFTNLRKLVINFQIYNGGTWNHKWNWCLEILEKSDDLQDLTIFQDTRIMGFPTYRDSWKDPLVVPNCLSTNLKNCFIRGFRGRECEIQFVEYILRHSNGLDSMQIDFDPSISKKTKFDVTDRIGGNLYPNPLMDLTFDGPAAKAEKTKVESEVLRAYNKKQAEGPAAADERESKKSEHEVHDENDEDGSDKEPEPRHAYELH